MEKKTYLAPQMRIHELYRRIVPFCSSPVRSHSSGDVDVDLGFGGVDEEGIINPAAKRRELIDYDGGLW